MGRRIGTHEVYEEFRFKLDTRERNLRKVEINKDVAFHM